MQFFPLIIIVVLFYFLLIRPQRKRDKENKAMLAAMKVGDKVTTIGGICGKVVKIKDNFVYIETGGVGSEAQKCTLKMERDAVKNVEQKKSN
ncbi:MAG: preprotein translocase subunit YajC [Oscillospiraceae bacterium]|nr:preprotein translocase subunit YajC [Oscillospiraceae bacterium]